MVEKLKEIINRLAKVAFPALGTVATLALVTGAFASSVLSHGGGTGALSSGFSSKPRFPIAGQQAEFTFTPFFNNGMPNTGLEPMVIIALQNSPSHTHASAARIKSSTEDRKSIDGMKKEGSSASNAGTLPQQILLFPVETLPGVYSDNVTIMRGGRYIATISVGSEEYNVVVSVRSSPVAWWYVGGLVGAVVIMAITIAVIKTVKRTW